MSFYGSIYYQLVDAFNRLWFSNQGKDSIIFPGEDKLVNPNPAEGVPEDTFEYHSPGRQGVIDLKSGNRWIVFTQNEEDKSFKIWHREADTESNIPGNGFYHVPNMYLVVQQDGEKLEQVIERCIQETSDRIAEEGGTFTLEENCRVVIEIPSGEDNVDPSHAIYRYTIDGEWEEELAATQGMVTILNPDDFFVTTESYAVDGAGHMIPGTRHLYKMPKSDVQEEIDALKARMTKNEEHDGEQDDDIDLLDEYVGDWSLYRGATSDKGFNYWMPGISDAIGDMCELIAGNRNTFNEDGSPKDVWSDWEDHRDVNIARVIGNLTTLRESLKSFDNAHFRVDDTKMSDISLIDVILYIKDNLVAANTTAITGHKGRLDNLTDDINRLTSDTLALAKRADDLEAKDIEIEADIDAINDPATGILITAKNYTDSLANGAVKANTDAITAINDPTTGILANAKSYTDNLANGAVKDNTNAITAINDTETGILAKANKYTDELANGAVTDNANAIIAINDGETGILKSANNYTDDEIDKLDYTDNTAADGQYVYSVNETDGVIAVEHKPLPTYTLTSGSTNGTVAFNGSDVIVKGLGTAAYSNIDAFDAAGAAATAKSEAIAEAKTETENQIQALTEGAIATAKSEAIAEAKTETENQVKALAEGAVADNSAAIDDLELLLQNYSELVAKVAELEGRIAALEPAPEDPEPEEPTPEEEGSESTT